MTIGIDWVIICDLLALIVGLLMGVSLGRPRDFGPYGRRY